MLIILLFMCKITVLPCTVHSKNFSKEENFIMKHITVCVRVAERNVGLLDLIGVIFPG